MEQINVEQNIKLVQDALGRLTASNATDVDLDYIRFLVDEIDRQTVGEPVESYEDGDDERDEIRDSLGLAPMGIVEKSIIIMQGSAGKLARELIDLKERRGMTSEDVARCIQVDVESIKALEAGGEMSMGDWVLYAVSVGGHIDINVTTLEDLTTRYPYLENNYEPHKHDEEN